VREIQVRERPCPSNPGKKNEEKRPLETVGGATRQTTIHQRYVNSIGKRETV
jgi:hypothetical protein